MKLSVLVSARRDSKYLAKFLFAYFAHTDRAWDTEILVMLNQRDTWNVELIDHFAGMVQFFKEDYNQGRAGLHNYYNELAKHATGDWIVYFCEDHLITLHNWNRYILDEVEFLGLDPGQVWCLVPTLVNEGPLHKVNHVLSRGYYSALGCISRSAWLDSYINDITERIPSERTIVLPLPMIYDFSADDPSPMAEAAAQSVLNPDFTEGSDGFIGFADPRTRQAVEADALELNQRIKESS